MTTRPRLNTDASLLRGAAAVGLFVVMAAAFLRASAAFGAPAGFPADASVTAAIGEAMFNLDVGSGIEGEAFLVAFEIIDVVLVAALVAAVMLARRDEASTEYASVPEAERPNSGAGEATRTDGGEP